MEREGQHAERGKEKEDSGKSRGESNGRERKKEG